jgi:hypothetical protein
MAVGKKGTREMNETEIKKIIIDTLSEQQAFRDLPPATVTSMVIDMVLAILRKAQEK